MKNPEVSRDKFAIPEITSDQTKFRGTADVISDVLTSQLLTDKYQNLQTEFIRRLSSTHTQEIKQLLELAELGDQFLRYLLTLAGDAVPQNRIIFTVVKTPSVGSIQSILAPQKKSDLATVVDLVDIVVEIVSGH